MITTYQTTINGHTITLKYDDTRGVHIIILDNWYYVPVGTGVEIELGISKLETLARQNKLPERNAA